MIEVRAAGTFGEVISGFIRCNRTKSDDRVVSFGFATLTTWTFIDDTGMATVEDTGIIRCD